MAWRDNPRMDRYVFYPREGLEAKDVAAAKRTAKALGATVVRAAAGLMLLEAGPEKAEQVARALPGWRYSADQKKAHKIPERTPLQRARLAAARGG